MKQKEGYNVSWVVDNGLCTSCGVCMGACTHNAISFDYGRERNTPNVNVSMCTNCGMCYSVCPGKGLALEGIGRQLFGEEKDIRKELCTGHYLKAYVGHSTNYDIRYHAATGGMVSQFLIYLLKKNIIDGAVVVRYKENEPFEPEPFIATTEEEILLSRSSKYVVLSFDKVADEISHSDKIRRIVVVGLPCHIQGWRLLASKNRRVRESIVGYFAIYCSINKTKLSLEYYPWRYKIDKEKVGRFAFRDDGCMGFMKFTNIQGEEMKKIPYLSFWYGTHSFFANPRCSLCIDQLGELADVSFGDIHIEPYSKDTIGTNSIITRSNYWDNILRCCKDEGFVTLDEISIGTLVKSQGYTKSFKKGDGVRTNIAIRHITNRKSPIYDTVSEGNLKANVILAELVKALQRGIGRHRSMWWLIRLLDIKRE